MTLPSSATPAEAAPESPAPAPCPDAPLTLRQEDFCRHYAATGNAAGAARDAGYATGSARQTGHDLLDRPAVAARVRAIRAAWRAVEREEAQILLGRLEQAWDAAVEKGSAALMLRVVKLQADLSGLDRRSAHRRAGLWPLPGEEVEERPVDGTEGPPEGPIAEAVRRGRHRTERALALHRTSRKALAGRKDFDEAAWLATAHRLHSIVEERRPRTPERADRRPARPMTNPDISLPGSLPESAHPAADAPDAPADPDISLHMSLHRAGLTPEENGDRRVVRVPRPRGRLPFFGEMSGDRPDDGLPDYIEYTEEEWEEYQAFRARADAAYLTDGAGPEDWPKHYTPGHDES